MRAAYYIASEFMLRYNASTKARTQCSVCHTHTHTHSISKLSKLETYCTTICHAVDTFGNCSSSCTYATLYVRTDWVVCCSYKVDWNNDLVVFTIWYILIANQHDKLSIARVVFGYLLIILNQHKLVKYSLQKLFLSILFIFLRFWITTK